MPKNAWPSIETAKNEPVKKDYKQVIKEQFKSSSLNFFMKPMNTKKSLIKLFWLIVLLVAILANVYYVKLIIFDYLKFDTTTSIYEINEKQSEFPTITFCCDNDFNFKNHNFDILITSLWFNMKDLKNEWQNHFEIYNDSSYGKCYRFNSGKNVLNESMPIKYSKKSGIDDGLAIEFYSNTSYNFSQIHIYIHNHTHILSTIRNKGTWIMSGSENYFVIDRIYHEKLERPYNDCYKNVSDSLFNKTIIDYMISTNYEYTQEECIEVCRNLKSIEEAECNCSIKSLNESFITKCIYKINNDDCSKDFIANFDVAKCNQYCPLECDSFNYDIKARSQTIVATGNISDYFESSLFQTNEQVANHYYGIYIYYENLKYTYMSQKPKIELFGFLSNIGGTFSLFLGLNILSFLELFEILANIMLKFFI
jgi:hypothetical protein